MIAYLTELNSSNFEDFTSKGLVLVDVLAVWCGPCKAIGPIVDEISNVYQGKLSVGKLDADSNREIIDELNIRNIPTLLIYKDGELVRDVDGNVDKLVGSITKEKLVEFVDKYLN